MKSFWRSSSPNRPKYEKACDESLLSEEERDFVQHTYSRPRSQQPCTWFLLTILNIMILMGSFISVDNRVESFFRGRNACLKETCEFSPVLEDIDVKFHEVEFNGTVWPRADHTFGRMEPGPEADRHWTEFDWIYAIPITRNEIVRLGKDPNLVAKFEDEFWGLGDDAYVGALDVFHQLHCVNALREYAFADFGEEIPTKKKHGNLQWVHLRHCVDILVQNIMCHADAGIHTYNWMDTQPQPFPDFSVNRKCRDFEQLRVYRDMHTVDMEKYKSMPKPKGVKQVSAEPEYYDIFGYEGSDLYPALSLKAQMEREEKERKEAKSS